MPTFIAYYENILETMIAEISVNDELNKRLSFLQEKGAKILDVKASVTANDFECRGFLIIYEAEKRIALPEDTP